MLTGCDRTVISEQLSVLSLTERLITIFSEEGAMNYSKSKKLFEAAQKVIPGGANSPVRAFRAVGILYRRVNVG
jgi:hypothetical protein